MTLMQRAAVAVLTALLIAPACVSFGVDSYEEFRSAIESGASCAQLFDIRQELPASVDKGNVDRDLREIGCVSRDSKRADA